MSWLSATVSHRAASSFVAKVRGAEFIRPSGPRYRAWYRPEGSFRIAPNRRCPSLLAIYGTLLRSFHTVVSVMVSMRPAWTRWARVGEVDPDGSADPVEGDTTFGDEAPDVAGAHVDTVGGLFDGEQLDELRRGDGRGQAVTFR